MSNPEWMPCIFELENPNGKVISSPWTIANIDDTDVVLTYNVPLPMIKDGKRLQLSSIRVGIQEASPTDRVKEIHARGCMFNKCVVFGENKQGFASSQRVQIDFPVHDCSGFDAVKIIVYLECTKQYGVDIGFVSVQYQYI